MNRYGTHLIAVCILVVSFPAFAYSAVPLRVMTFNIRYGTADDGENSWPQRKHLVAKTIRRFDPDLLGVQEALAFQLDYLQEQLPGYQRVGVGRDDGRRKGEFSALLLRKNRLDVSDSGTRWLSDTPEMPGSLTWEGSLPRVFTWASLRDKRIGNKFLAVNTHWDHQSQTSRNKSAVAIADQLKVMAGDDVPVILLGDLNAGPKNPAVESLLTKKTRLRDTFAAGNPSVDRIGTFHGYHGSAQGDQIDWILATKEWKVSSAGVETRPIDERYPSDHFPVWSVLELEE